MTGSPSRVPTGTAALLATVLLLSPPVSSFAGSMTSPFRFRTLETDHFQVHFHEGLDNVAANAAGYAEKAHARMADGFLWSPAGKTHLVLVDAFDFPNGFATSLPYNTIYVFPVPPEPDSTIGESESWLEATIVHEYAHILTGDPSRGYSSVTRKIFGKPLPGADPLSLSAFLLTAPPNTFLPRWWHEGMATWAESTYSGRGRDNSVFFDMIFRMDVLEGKVPTIDRINESLPFWPAGTMPYLYGSKFVSYLARTRGAESPGRLSRIHAGRFPYALNGAPEQLFDRVSYAALYREMIFDLDRGQKANLAALSGQPATEERTVSADGERLTHPRFSPDGKRIAWTRQDPHGHEAIVVANADGSGAREAARRVISDGALSWSPDGATIYFCQAEVHDEFKVYQDLFALDVGGGRVTRLTRGLRLAGADASPDGRSFAAIVAGNGSRDLAILTRAGDGWLVARATDLSGARMSGPRWSPDGTAIACVATDERGVGRLFVHDVARKTTRTLFETTAPIASPAWSADGRFLLFASGETGVYNLFACPADGGERRQVTHLLGGAFHPDVSPGGDTIAYSSYRASGFRIAAVPYRPDGWRGTPGPAIRVAPPAPRADSPPPAGPAAPAAASRPYSPLPTVGPRFWLPVLLADHEGAVGGAFTAGQDVLARHSWLGEAGAGLSSGKGYFAATYANDSFRPTLRLRGYSLPVLYADLTQRGDYWERDTGLVAETILPVSWIESRLRLALGYRYRKERALTPLPGGTLAGLPVFEGRRDSVFATLAYSSALRYLWSISEEEGRTISVTARNSSRRLGSDLSGREYTASWNEFLSMPWRAARHHVASIGVRGGLSDGERPVQGAFQLGGPPVDLADFPLRGYPSRFRGGEKIATASLEYRAPVLDIFRGPGTRPVFFDRLHGAAFVDAGRTWGDGSDGVTRIGAGIEARLAMTLGYWLPIEPALGFARGFDRDGRSSAYFVLRALPP